MMRGTVLVTIAVAIAGCDAPDTQPPAHPAAEQPTPPGEVAAEHDGFVLLAGNDTLAIERFVREGNELRGSLHDVRSGARMDYRAVVTDDGRVIGMHIDLVEPGAFGPSERVAVSLRNDTLVVHQDGANGEDGDGVLLPRGTTLYLNPSIALLEAMLQRAESVGDGQEFPVLALDTQGDPAVIAPIVTRENGTVRLQLAVDRAVRLEVEDRTTILRGENVGQIARFERIR
jgi:hypothetical protein